MKRIYKFSAVAAASVVIASASLTAKAGGLSSVLDGMFANVTAPDVVSNQFRGAIVGGGMYVRSPISSLNVMSLDPPRLNVGCGGIDLYLGSFSFITAEKLTQFIRNVAQNAAPLAFKMALDASFPQLGGVLDKFQHMAQMMNDSQRNSCQLAHGIMDGAKNPEEVYGNLTKMVGDGMSALKGWSDDFTGAFMSTQAEGSTNVSKARQQKNNDGTQVVAKMGNITWNALKVRENNGILFSVMDDMNSSKIVVLSLIGTQVNKEGATKESEPVSYPFPPQRLRLADLFRPTPGSSGAKEIPVWSCQNDFNECLSPMASTLPNTGIEGYVRKQMFGTEEATTAQAGSIVHQLKNCSDKTCGLTTSQKRFLNSVQRLPAVGYLMKVQAYPGIVDAIAPALVDGMVDDIAALYGRGVYDLAIRTYSGSELPKPDNFDETVREMLVDIREAESRSRANIERMNQISLYIDTAIRSNSRALSYRPR